MWMEVSSINGRAGAMLLLSVRCFFAGGSEVQPVSGVSAAPAAAGGSEVQPMSSVGVPGGVKVRSK